MENDSFTFYSGNLGFFVRSVGHFDFLPGQRSRIKHAAFGEIFWCIEGSGKFIDSEGRKFTLLPEWVWYYPPGSLHNHGAGKERFHYRWLTLDGPLADAVFSGLRISPGLTHAGVCPEEYFDRIARNAGDPEKMPEMLSDAFYIFTRIIKGVKQRLQPDSMAIEARTLVDTAFSNPELNVEQIADRLQCHRVSLNRVFKEQFGITISEYLHSCRCREAFHLIRETEIPLAEIPLKCGFSSIHYMSRVIRQLTGLPPGALRKSAHRELSNSKDLNFQEDATS
ncbi:MAG: helix-turn-helix domain-containing protein [Lentisphaeria bacterium]|nr:helix-turn-helix domain-containing protein [Lentisphaeria bacterium]